MAKAGGRGPASLTLVAVASVAGGIALQVLLIISAEGISFDEIVTNPPATWVRAMGAFGDNSIVLTQSNPLFVLVGVSILVFTGAGLRRAVSAPQKAWLLSFGKVRDRQAEAAAEAEAVLTKGWIDELEYVVVAIMGLGAAMMPAYLASTIVEPGATVKVVFVDGGLFALLVLLAGIARRQLHPVRHDQDQVARLEARVAGLVERAAATRVDAVIARRPWVSGRWAVLVAFVVGSIAPAIFVATRARVPEDAWIAGLIWLGASIGLQLFGYAFMSAVSIVMLRPKEWVSSAILRAVVLGLGGAIVTGLTIAVGATHAWVIVTTIVSVVTGAVIGFVHGRRRARQALNAERQEASEQLAELEAKLEVLRRGGLD